MRAVIDTNVLLAIAARVELIVSGDGDLLSLGSFAGIPIIPPAKAVGVVEAARKA